eukprot:CAMPEP_0184009076 /NCGR_PEP_ID=MMETSP0954-20121128/2378_1 /TAXON_ID=627963 /ORGANISM="Aplanochytrium sp, Strain PBS07" /LENGTH=398 /DNA_ID=CAMNT_0026288357 /DNA_START=128 /DNA_END=1321 /DNA_ORIENTATION=+
MLSVESSAFDETKAKRETATDNSKSVDRNEILKLGKSSFGNIKSLKKKLSERGWCFVELPEETKAAVSKFVDSFDSFLEKDEVHKAKFHVPPMLGYEKIGHKQVFRNLTGTELKEQSLPFDGAFAELAKVMDNLSTEFVKSNCDDLFGCSFDQLKQRTSVPILQDDTNSKRFGVLDAVRYFEDDIDDKINPEKTFCAPHYDPGLLAMSLYSDAPGLEFYDPVEKCWVSQPKDPNVSVLWCGQEIMCVGDYKPAIHRVNVNAKTRTSIWYEMCSECQVSHIIPGYGDVAESLQSPEGAWVFPNVYKVGTGLSEVEALPMKTKEEKFLQACRRLEAKKGIPMMKSIRPGKPTGKRHVLKGERAQDFQNKFIPRQKESEKPKNNKLSTVSSYNNVETSEEW